ncbi:unnamed protein product [Bemisia tabaci]|uniref:Uncharacterized protein n=1 Tax=Bemisia tabaci TaxID=7038 RepID=A0A9P0AMB8_BEMTA|nr:unnamed protein product [Bemisia tabaci]
MSLHVDMRGFHLNPLKRKGKSKEKPKKVKDATHTIPKEDFVINLKDYDSVINQVAATLQDSDRFHTFTEPPVTLDSSSIFQSSFDDKDLLINLISLDPVFDRLDKEFGLDDLEELNILFLNYVFVINIFSIVFPVTTLESLLSYRFLSMCPPSLTSKWTSDTIAMSCNKSEIIIRSG